MKMHEFQIMEMYKQIGYRDIDCDGKLEPPVTIKLPQCAIDWLKAVEREDQRDSYSVWGLASMAVCDNYVVDKLMDEKPTSEFEEWLEPDDPFVCNMRLTKMILATIYPYELEER